MCHKLKDLTCSHLTCNPPLDPRSHRHRCLPRPLCHCSFSSSFLFLSPCLSLSSTCLLHLHNEKFCFFDNCDPELTVYASVLIGHIFSSMNIVSHPNQSVWSFQQLQRRKAPYAVSTIDCKKKVSTR